MQSEIDGSKDGSLPVTVLLAANNEEVNLPRCLAALEPAARVILLDSRSTDCRSSRSSGFSITICFIDDNLNWNHLLSKGRRMANLSEFARWQVKSATLQVGRTVAEV